MIDTSGRLMFICEKGHKMKWSGSKKMYTHMMGDARCTSTRVTCVPANTPPPRRDHG